MLRAEILLQKALKNAHAKTKAQISCAVTEQQISAFVYVTKIEHPLFFLNPKVRASSCTARFVSDLVGNPNTGFLMTLLMMTLLMTLRSKEYYNGFWQMSRVMRKPTFWFSTRSDTNQAVQSQKMARNSRFRIKVVEGLYYPFSENKGADQLRSNCAADLRLCFRICKKPVFS